MLDELKNFFKEGLQYTHTAGVLQQLANIVNIVHTQYTKDSDAKNAAIDVICQMLQSHKDIIPPVEVTQAPTVQAQEPANAPN